MKFREKERRLLNGKVAIITGSSGGIGKATALLLCSLGAKVVLNGRDGVKLENCVREFKDQGFEVIGVAGDLSLPEESRKLVEQTLSKFGTLDILINNAGISMRGDVGDLDPEVVKMVFSSNVYGSLFPLIYALPYIKASRGSVVFISSAAGIRGLPGLSIYCSSKMALTAVAESMRFELKSSGVHIGVIYVGIAENDPGKTYVDKDGSLKPIEPRDGKNPLTKEEIARAVVKNIVERRFMVVLSTLGKLNAIMQRISPGFVEWILMRNYNKLKSISK